MTIMLSYPKSGRTWLRFMVNSYLCRVCQLDCRNVFEAEKLLRDRHPIEWTHLTGAMIARLPYWAMGPWKLDNTARRLPWVFLTRNFQATLASAYFQARDRIRVFDGTPSQFLRDPRNGVIKLVSFYNLFETIRPTLTNCKIISYEAVLEAPKPALKNIVETIGLPIDDTILSDVVKEASFDNMKRLSVTPEYAGTVLAPTDPTRPETFKVRSGGRDKAQLFNDEDLAYIDRVVGDLFLHQDKPEYRSCLGQPTKPSQANKQQPQTQTAGSYAA